MIKLRNIIVEVIIKLDMNEKALGSAISGIHLLDLRVQFSKQLRYCLFPGLVAFVFFFCNSGITQMKNKVNVIVHRENVAALSLSDYLTRVRLDNSTEQAAPGSIWVESGRLTKMTTDVRAMRPHDLISVVVTENIAASTDDTVGNSRQSNASTQITALMGLLHAGNALQNVVNQSSIAGLTAKGASATSSSLTTTFGGQVIEVLPNGMLVIEAAREVEFSQQTQTIVLRGLVRPEDISQQNQVLSTAISSLELQVRGKGINSDFTHRQNLLVRLLQKVLIF